MHYTRQEMMAIAAGREIRDGELAIFGVGLSMLAGYFAQAHHAPNVRSMNEGGVYGATPVGGLPWGIECTRISANATSFTGALDALGCLVASGRCDVGIIGAAQIDRYGNVNTTGIWREPASVQFRPPKVRMNGSGGANDIASGCQRFIVMAAHERKRFVERVDYLTSPGYLDGGDARQRYPFAGGGPSAIVTTLGILRPDPETKEFLLTARYAFADVDEIVANTGWPLRVVESVEIVPEPTDRELAVLRQVDQTGMLRRDANE
jgi:glutaconate CoA-transferase subunit B